MSPRGRNDLNISVDLDGAVQWMMWIVHDGQKPFERLRHRQTLSQLEPAFLTTLSRPAASFFLKLPPSTLLHIGGQRRLVEGL